MTASTTTFSNRWSEQRLQKGVDTNMARILRYEGGHIGIRGSRKEAVDWYCRHLGMRVAFDHEGDGQTVLLFPVRHGLPVVTAEKWGMTGQLQGSSAVRFCLASPDLESTHAVLMAEGVRTTPILPGPGGYPCFDFYGPEGTRLTAVGNPALQSVDAAARFLGYAPLRIGVRNLEQSVAWYLEVFGATLLEQREGLAVIGLADFLPLWLEVSDEAPAERPSINYDFLPADIDETYRYCLNQRLKVSELRENGGHRQFCLYDPDGNRLNIHTYPDPPGAIGLPFGQAWPLQ